jgi:transcriptional/translational regulatory protein YebC/TACO1
MAGHSHAKNVRVTKEKNDKIKAKRNTILGRALLVAAAGNPDPRTNAKLEAEIKRVKSMGLPKDNIERVLKAAAGNKDGKTFTQVVYDAYWNKIAFVIIVETDNNSRTAPEIKNIFKSLGGEIANPNSAASFFKKFGFLSINLNKLLIPQEKVEEILIEYDIEDCEFDEDHGNNKIANIYFATDCFATNTKKIIEELEKYVKDLKDEEGFILDEKIIYTPDLMKDSLKEINDDKIDSFKGLLEKLENNDDIIEIFHNAKI